MKRFLRSLGALTTLLMLAISMPGAQQPAVSDWQIGDVFVGIGTWDTATGQYLVYNADGTPKMVPNPDGGADIAETLFDAGSLLDLDSWGYPEGSFTTGCAVAPDDSLFVTTFWGRKLRRFSPIHPHGDATVVHDFATNGANQEEVNGIDAVESIVFDDEGNFYVGVHPTPRRETSADELNAFAKIFRFPAGYDPATSPPPTVYEVPNGEVGVDWIELGPDGKTLYYTSESDRVYWYRPAEGAVPAQAGSFRVHEPEMPGSGVGGRLYAFRALPPKPGETAPSGFLFAHQRGPVRTDVNGKIEFWYATPGAVGSFFGLNITPDGKYFWTANYPNELPGSGGQLYKYNISHRQPVKGPIATGAPVGAYGICVKREYTAAVNTCYASDQRGNILYDAGGNPVVQRDPVTNLPMCKVPEICGNSAYATGPDGERVMSPTGQPLVASGDEDGDGLHDDVDPDCVPSGPPRVLLPNREHPEHTPIDIDISALAFDPDGDPLTFSAVGLPPGLAMSPAGRITGTTPAVKSGPPYVVTVTVVALAGTADAQTVVTTFEWTVTGNKPPELENPGDVTCIVGYACPLLRLPVHDDDRDAFIATVTPGARPWAPGVDCSVGDGCTGLPPGMSLPPDGFINSGGQPDYTFDILGIPGYVGTETVSGVEGIFTVEVCGIDHTIADDANPHAPTCETFRITILNRAPEFTIFAPNQLHIVGQPMTPVTVAATDEDGGPHLPITFTSASLPQGVTMTPAGVISGTPVEEMAGRVVTLTASDQFGKTASTTFTWTVTNYVPTVTGTDQTTIAGTPIVPVTMAGADDARDGTYQWPLTWSLDGVPPGLTFTTASGAQTAPTTTGTVSFAGTPTAPGDYTVSLQVTDRYGKTGVDTFLWRVTNRAPVPIVVPRVDVAGKAITPYTLSATDPDGHALTYSVSGLPAGLTFDAATHTISGTPLTPTPAGSPATVTVTVDDPYANAPAPYSGRTIVTFPWTISNIAPVPTVADRTTVAGRSVTDAIPASDADGHTVSWSISGLPTGLTYNASTGAVTGTATAVGEYPVTVRVSDPYSFTDASFTWRVTNVAPVPTVANRSTIVGTTVSDQVPATDADGHAITWTMSGLPDGLGYSQATGGVSGLASKAGVYPVTVTVADPYSSTTAHFTWTVVNNPPAFPVANQATLIGTPVVLAIGATDPEGHSMTYVIAGLPPGLSASPTGVITGTPMIPVANQVVTVTVTDQYGAVTTKTFLWTVYSNRPPVAVDDTASAVGTSPTNITVLSNDSDPDNDALTIVPSGFTQPANGAVALAPGGGFVYTASLGFSGVDSFTYTISDGIETDVATVTITVAPARVCYVGQANRDVTATQDWWYNPNGSLTIRTTVGRAFNDNTYGDTAIGWPGNGNHKFNHLVTSDFVQIALYDQSNARRLEMKLDYFSQSSLFPSGYGSRGVTGGDGSMIYGSSSQVLSADSSLAKNFNEFGYVLTTDSPATDESYTANPQYPNWIFDVWFEVTVSPSAFGSGSFKYPRITGMHASPAKTGLETEPMTVVPCADVPVSGVTPPVIR